MNQATAKVTDMPQTAVGHFQLCFYAAVYYLLHTIYCLGTDEDDTLEETLAEFPFLAAYFQAMLPFMPQNISWAEGLVWWRQSVAHWSQAARQAPENGADLPLARLDGVGQAQALRQITLVLVGLVEEDSRFGTLMAHLQRPLTNRRPTLELVTQIIGAEAPLQALLQAGLISVPNKALPRAEWQLHVPGLLWDVVRGGSPTDAAWFTRQSHDSLPQAADLFFPEEFMAQLQLVPPLIESGQVNGVILRGSPGSDRLHTAGFLARALGRHLVRVTAGAETPSLEPALLGPFCTLSHAIPLFVYDLSPGEHTPQPALTGYSGPYLIALGLAGGVQQSGADNLVTLTLPETQLDQRHQQWRSALGRHAPTDLTEICRRFRLPGGTIRQLAPLALTQAALRQDNRVTLADVQAASRLLNRQTLDSLAAPLPAAGSWDEVVVGGGAAARLQELTLRCRHREQLLDHLSPVFGATGPGVRALFTGGSGTGKTLAAQALAAELGMDLYRVDLAAVVNKYIGETEKNLHRILSYAEELDVLLLLDEGDALLSSRTDVKSANDRYANLETNYLLQRLEHYKGIVVVTTNLGENIDGAFLRRMDVVVNFVPPQAEERLRIWRLHLPPDHVVSSSFLETVAQRCQLTGGQIRNAAFHATLLALATLSGAEGVVSDEHLNQAVASEYRKAGATSPLPGNGRSTHHNGNVASFLKTLS